MDINQIGMQGTRLLWRLPKLSNVRFSSELSSLPNIEDQGFQSKVKSADYKTVSHHLLHGHKSDLTIAHEQGSTMASLPVPEGSWEENYKKNNGRWNLYLAGSLATFAGIFSLCYQRSLFFGNTYNVSDWKKVKIDLNEKPFEIEYSEVELNSVEEALHEKYISELGPWAEQQLNYLPADARASLIKAFVNDMFVVDTGYAELGWRHGTKRREMKMA